MSALRAVLFSAILAVLLLVPRSGPLAQDDESPEQKKMLEVLEEREKVAEEEKRAAVDSGYKPDAGLMEAKEKDRAGEIREEERDLIEESSGRRRWYRR